MDVAGWLQQLGLERYEAAFRENHVSAAVLPSLTAEDLKEIGVAPVGHRRQLLEAIAVLRGDAMARGDQSQVSRSDIVGSSTNDQSSGAIAERRQLSVMFCDIIGFTALSSRLDPEDLSAVIRDYQARVATAIGLFGGFIARYVGDGVLIYFGWPEAHEVNAERAVRAAIAVVEAVGQAPVRAESLQVRIGIATGLVVVGEPIGTGEARQQTAIGETPNLAARLQGLAEPNEVVIDAITRRQIGGLFDCRDLGLVSLKGLPEPVRAWQVLGQAAVESPFEALHATALPPLVGRQEELDLLLRRWTQARAGQGRIVMISGEPGIGKSRLLAAFEEELRGDPHIRLRYFCSPHHQSSPLHPVIRQLEFAAGFARDDTPADRLGKLRQLLAHSDSSAEDVALLAALLLLPADGLPKLNLSPHRRKERTFQALIHQVEYLSTERPLLMLFEDVHWADPSTREVLDFLIEHLGKLRVLIVMTFRPEVLPPWIRHAGATLMTLSRLDRADATSLAARMTSESVLSPELIDRIVAQSDGVPLFVEELTKAVMETAHAAVEAATIAVPATLQASLLARLDRIPVAKQVAQIGAVIGREFSHALVAGVSQVSDAQLAQGLDELVASGLASRRGLGPDAVYTFKHVLVQDATYESLLRSRRAEIHAAIVALAETGPLSGTIEPGILAHHSVQAGLIAKAAAYYRIAGERSAERLVAEETKAQLERGLQFAERLPLGPDRYRLEAELLIALGRILLPILGQTHPETSKILERAVETCRKVDNATMLARSLYALGIVAEVRGDLRTALALGDEFLALAKSSGDISIGIAARVRLGGALLYEGRFVAARDNLAEGLALCTQGSRVLLDVAVSSTPDVSSLAYLAHTLVYLGYVDQAAAHVKQAVARARQLGQIPLAFALHFSIRISLAIRDDVWCREAAEMQVAITEEQGLPSFLAPARCALGWITAKQGDIPKGLNMLTTGIAYLAALDHQILTSLLNSLLSDVLAWSGRFPDATAALDEALVVSGRTGAGWLDAELHRRKGELLITGSNQDPTAAEGEFREAIDIARRQSAKLFELRASGGLARLLNGYGRRAEGHALLAPIYAWFTEGLNTPDLADARALLTEVAGTSAQPYVINPTGDGG